jgi:hypothetical protein
MGQLGKSSVRCRPLALSALFASACSSASVGGLHDAGSSIHDAYDPGPNFVLATPMFDADYFYCHVEPQFIFAQKCGPGLPSDYGGCHFSPAVSGMFLADHPAIDCGGGDHPTVAGLANTGGGSPAQSNLASVSFEMAPDHTMAPLFLRPTGQIAHPRMIFAANDPTVIELLSTWAAQ